MRKVRKVGKRKQNGKDQGCKDFPQFQKDAELELLIEDMGTEGEGIGKAGGLIFFVKDAVLGDRIRAKVIKMKKNYGYARLIQVLAPSPYRVQPCCAYARQCGGCQIQPLAYQQQLEFKENKVKNNLERIGGLSPNKITPIIGMEEPYFYRNKAQFPIQKDSEGKIIVGFYASHSHAIVPNRKCYLGMWMDTTEKILDTVVSFLEENQIPAYDETTGTGLARHLLIRFGHVTQEIMVCLVINGKKLPRWERLVEHLQEINGITGILLNINEKNTNVILGIETVTLWGKDYITDFIGNVKYQISPLSFYQVNPVQTKKLYEMALKFAGLTGTETVWDLYCGIGTISLFLAQKAKQVYGVEVVAPAIADARRNAQINGIKNAEFFVGRAEEVLPAFYENGIWQSSMAQQEPRNSIEEEVDRQVSKEMLQPDVIVVDPPRKGCDEKCLEIIAKMKPERVVYVSCDSATLARDLKYLCREGYEVKEVGMVDMFPHTVHVESICLLHRKDS